MHQSFCQVVNLDVPIQDQPLGFTSATVDQLFVQDTTCTTEPLTKTLAGNGLWAAHVYLSDGGRVHHGIPPVRSPQDEDCPCWRAIR